MTPIIGSNGNWFIKGIDTNVPARGADGINGITPEIGANGNWEIDGVDTGVPAKGQDGDSGVDGKTSYELWKEAVDAGEMTNKDGSDYTGGNTWEDFLKWLQGGDLSVLHQYWVNHAGGVGDLSAFIEALFDCHCDNIIVIIIAPDDCVKLDATGNMIGTHSAVLKVGAEVGAEIQVSGDGFPTATKTVASGDTEVEFTLPRTDESVTFTILVTKDGEATTKFVSVPKLKYIEFGSAKVEQVGTDQKDVATITFVTAPSELTVGNTIVYDDINGVTDGTGWVVSNEGKTFTKTYDRGPTVQELSFQARSEDGACSILNDLLVIPSYPPVTINGEPSLVINDCDMAVVMTGTPGMTVKATYSGTTITMAESPAGTYSHTFPRKYTGYTINITASKAGAGNATKTIIIGGDKLLPEPFAFNFDSPNTNNPEITGTFTNKTTESIEIEFSRGNNTSGKGKERAPWIEGIAGGIGTKRTVTLAAGATQDITFHRDVADDFSSGRYTVTFKTNSQCEQLFSRSYVINNQTDFNHGFKKIDDPANPGGEGGYPGGGGSDPYDPDYPTPVEEEGYTIFEVTVTNATPESYVQLLAFTSNGYGSLWGSGKKTDANGNLKILVKMKNSDIEIANDKKAEFKFSKEKVSSQFTHTKDITFNLPL